MWFAAAVDNCLSQGLKKRISGIFKGNLTTASLIKHLAKHHPEAAEVAHKVQEIEARLEEANKWVFCFAFFPHPLILGNPSSCCLS